MFQKPSVRKSLDAMQALFTNSQNVVVLSTLFCYKSKNSTTWVTEENWLCLSQIQYEFLSKKLYYRDLRMRDYSESSGGVWNQKPPSLMDYG